MLFSLWLLLLPMLLWLFMFFRFTLLLLCARMLKFNAVSGYIQYIDTCIVYINFLACSLPLSLFASRSILPSAFVCLPLSLSLCRSVWPFELTTLDNICIRENRQNVTFVSQSSYILELLCYPPRSPALCPAHCSNAI